MCRTLRGGRAEAITTFTPVAGKQRSATAALAQTFFDLSSNVPSRSIATSLMMGGWLANASSALVSWVVAALAEDGSGWASPLLLAVIRKVIGDDPRLLLS